MAGRVCFLIAVLLALASASEQHRVNTTAALSWTAHGNSSWLTTQYEVICDPDCGVHSVEGTATSVTIPLPLPGVPYAFTVWAINADINQRQVIPIMDIAYLAVSKPLCLQCHDKITGDQRFTNSNDLEKGDKRVTNWATPTATEVVASDLI